MTADRDWDDVFGGIGDDPISPVVGEIDDFLHAVILGKAISGPRTIKSKGRPRAAKTIAIREAIVELTERFEKMTVRGIFYKLAAVGVVPKDHNKGYRPVQRQVLALRREELIPWSFVSDGTRWVRRADTFTGIEDALRSASRFYRRDLWAAQERRVEIWLEKDALADLVFGTADRWGVPLYVSRGVPSETYVHSAAVEARQDGRPLDVFCLYDYDAGGDRAFRKVGSMLEEHAPGLATVHRAGLTADQVAAWDLPTRPAKKSDPEAAKWAGKPAVELDAVDPDLLCGLVDDLVGEVVDQDALRVVEIAEAEERKGLESLARNFSLGSGSE